MKSDSPSFESEKNDAAQVDMDPNMAEQEFAYMSIWEHLDELRKRILYAALSVFFLTIGAWLFREKILKWLFQPYFNLLLQHHLPTQYSLQTLSPGDAFLGYLQLSVMVGFVLAIPVIFYQLWAFISPGLYQKEKRLIVPFVTSSTALFLSGVLFARYVALPFTFDYFLTFSGQVDGSGIVLSQNMTLEYYLDFVTQTLVAFGFVFELPLFVTFLVLAKLVTPHQLWKFSRWAILISFIVGAIVTPGTDVASQVAVSSALVLLYVASIGLAYLFSSKPRGVENIEGSP